MSTRRSWALVVSLLAGCSALPGRASDDGAWRTTGRILFEHYQSAHCGEAGPSPLRMCWRETYRGGLRGSGVTAVQSMDPVVPDGVVSITENEVLRLADGTLTARVNAVYDSKSPDREVVSPHSITAGTGRYAGASGHIRLWGKGGDDAGLEYVAVIHLAK